MRKIQRKDGRLPTLDSTIVPTHIVCFDTETEPTPISEYEDIHNLIVGVALYSRLNKKLLDVNNKECIFYDTDSFINFILENVPKRETVYIFAHNVAFDLMVLEIPTWFADRVKTLKPPIRNHMIMIWTVKYESRNLVFVNTANYVQKKLDDIGADLNVRKLDIDFKNTSLESLIDYCRQDCVIIKTLMLNYIKFIKDNNLGAFKTTIASQALTAYRHRFNNNLPYTHTVDKVLYAEKLAYKGGRTDCYKLGYYNSDTYYYLDINSMYPYVMSDDLLPKRFVNAIYNRVPQNFNNLVDYRYLIVDCTLKIDIPFLAVSYKSDKMTVQNKSEHLSENRLIFPVGNIREVLHHTEFMFALEHNFIQKINAIYIYEKSNVFSDYVEFFNNHKVKATMDNNDTQRLLAKIFLNSLYGKFAQQYRWFEQIAENPEDYEQVEMIRSKYNDDEMSTFKWQNQLWANFKKGLVEHSIPALAGAVTAKARMLLFEYMLKTGRENTYYTDTDSIITNSLGLDNLRPYLSKTELGKLSVDNIANEMKIIGCKHYHFGDNRVIKGVPKLATESGDNRYDYALFEGFGMWLRRGADRPPLVSRVSKQLLGLYDKGIINDDNTISPYEVHKHSL